MRVPGVLLHDNWLPAFDELQLLLLDLLGATYCETKLQP
jgi:hypothetical protein